MVVRWTGRMLVVLVAHMLCLAESSVSQYRHLVNNDAWPEYTRGKGAYKWVLSPIGRKNGITYVGSNTRLRVAMQKLKDGKPLHITTVGASITAGTGVIDGHTWPQYVFNYLADHYGDQVTGTNGGIGATRSSYLNVCHNLHVLPNTDLILVEYSFTSLCKARHCEQDRVTEQLVRKLLSYPSKPAIVFVHAMFWMLKPEIHNWWYGGEAQYNELSAYYQIPSLSIRTCCWHLFTSNYPGFNTTSRKPNGTAYVSFFSDGWHPDGLTGARVFAELVIQLLIQTIDSLQSEPVTTEERAVAIAPLPEPLEPGNYENPNDSCFMNSHFLSLVKRNENFTWIDESRDPRFGKFGMVAKTVGAVLEIGLDTRSFSLGYSKTADMVVLLSYLKSYHHMGRASVDCISGCTCASTIMDGHVPQYSLMEFHQLMVSQSEMCVIRITVSNETSSGEHKVKIIGAIISEGSNSDHSFSQWRGHLSNAASAAGATSTGTFDVARRAGGWT